MRGAAFLLAAFGLATGAAAAKADVLLSGPTSNAGSYSTAQLAALATAGDTVNAGGLTGISLWGLLGGAASSSPTSPVYGDITTTTPAGDNGKNAILRYYVVGAGGGQASIVSLGEINPSFGGPSATPAFVAFQTMGGSLLAQPELVVPGQPTRDLSTLSSLQLTSVAASAGVGGGKSTTVTLSGNVANPGSYDQAALEALTPVTQTTVAGTTYTGTPLASFIDATGDINTTIVDTVGTDGYSVAFALGEVDPAVGGNPQDILTWASDGADFPTDALARTIFPTDNKHGRWNSNIYAVEVTDIPEPASASVVVAGLGLLRLVRRRSARLDA